MEPEGNKAGRLPPALITAILSVLVAVLLIAAVALLASGAPSAALSGARPPTPNPAPTWPPTPNSTPVPSPSPRIVLAVRTPTPTPTIAWQSLGYLTSMRYSTTAVVDLSRVRAVGPVVVTRDRVIMEAVGQVYLAVDLSQVRSSDVRVDGDTVRLVLPRAEVTSVELLPDQSRITTSEMSWVASQYPGLESAALTEARARLQASAIANKEMLGLAERLAQLQLTEFLQQMGFARVEITFREPSG